MFIVGIVAAGQGWATDITFLATSDSQCGVPERDARNQAAIREMNEMLHRRWPAKFGAEPVGRPRGVVMLGDLVEHGKQEQGWQRFVADFGLDGTEGLLKFPVFEGWGNHDGETGPVRIRERNEARLKKKLISKVSDNGLHYSWDWDGVHFVQLNLYPGNHAKPPNDPQWSLSFLKTDLAETVGRSGRPVVLLHHYDLQNFKWWTRAEMEAYHEAIRGYNIVLICHGHSGLGVYTWNDYDVINTGQTENGFFVVRITDQQLRVAYRGKHEDGWRWHLMQERKLRRGLSAETVWLDVIALPRKCL